MTDILFARTRYDYGSYQDFWKVAELSGFHTVYLDEVDWTREQTVIGTPFNGEWYGIPMDKRTRLVHWNIERCRDEDGISPSQQPAYVNETWASDRAMARRHGFRYVFMGGHRAFGSISVMKKQFDIITLMAHLPRRYTLLGELKQFSNGDVDGGAWGEERRLRLMQSRLMVTAHQDDLPYSEPPRMMIGGCYGMPMLTEDNEDSGYWVKGVHYESAPLKDIALKTFFMLEDEVRLARLGAAAWSLCCVEHPFRKCVEEAVNSVEVRSV